MLSTDAIPSLTEFFCRRVKPQTRRVNEVLCLDGAQNAWFIVSGQIDLFIVRTETGGVDTPWRHFITADAGSLVFGLDFNGSASGMSLRGTCAEQTMFCALTIEHVQELAEDTGYAGSLEILIDEWVLRVSEAVSKDVRPIPKAEGIPGGRERVLLGRGKVVRAGRGIVWMQLRAGATFFLGTELMTASQGDRPTLPVSPQTWMEGDEDSVLSTMATRLFITQPCFPSGLDLFHGAVSRCLAVNRRLRLVDEYNQIRRRAAFDNWLREAALADIASVLTAKDGHASIDLFGDLGDQLLAACKLVGEASDIEIKTPPGLRQSRDKIFSIAKASRCRIRRVALRDQWWEQDHGPLLAFRVESNEPVAILKRKTTLYELADPKTKERIRINEVTAGLVQPFAVSFYRALPGAKLRNRDLLIFGLRGSISDLWTVVAMGVLIGLLGMVAPFFSGQLLDSLIPAADRTQLLEYTLGLVVAAFGALAFELVRAVAVMRLAGQMDASLQAAVIDRLLDLPSTFFRRYASGDLADRSLGIGQIRQVTTQAGTQAVVNCVSALIMFLFLFTFDWQMALAAVLPLFASLALPSIANLVQLRFQTRLFHIRGRISGLLFQLFDGVSKLRVAGAEDRAFREWSGRFAAQKRLAFQAGKVANVVQISNQVLPVISSAFLFGLYAYLRSEAVNSHGDFRMTTGQFVAFYFTFINILSALLQVSTASLDLMGVFPLAERLKPIVETLPEVDSAKAHPGELSGEIEIWHVTFRYDKDGPTVLKDISLHVRPGEYVALVGGSGSGKSTLLRILLGFEQPEAGSVFYDGQDLGSLDVREVRQQIGVVLQSSRLIPTDIYRNIVGSSNLGMDVAWEAARMAGLERDIKAMPMGMHTIVSEGGVAFSGGQRQRLMIARALARKPRILFFDEATSALDNETQRTVSESLDSLQATRIVIAHRLSTIMHADRIVVLKDGQPVQVGRYEELLHQKGPFADLAARQVA